MADTNTAILGLVKPDTAPGGSTDTWGAKWNDNFDDIDALFELSGGDPVLKQSKGGTGAKTAAGARANLGASAVGEALFIAEDATAACEEFEAASPARFALVSQSTDVNETEYPVGTLIVCHVISASEIDINGIAAPRLSSANNRFISSGSGSLLGGTWRSRGAANTPGGTPGGTGRNYFLQRVA